MAIIAGGAAARVVLGALIGLGVDESYAIAVARPVSLSYFDHPPLVFWISAATTRVFGSSHDLLLRLPFILLFAASSWLLFALTLRLFDGRAALITVLLAQVIPVYGVSDGGWILPDGPLLLGFALSALCLAHIALDEDASRMRGWWIGAGLGAGIAALSKYHAVFLFAGALVFLLTSARRRAWLARAEPYVAAVIAIVIAAPVLAWNARHDWASFRFQGGRAVVHVGWPSLTALLQNIGGQAGYLLPWVWVPLVWLFVRAIRRGPDDTRSWLLVCLGGGPAIVFTLIALGGRAGLPHWPAPGFFLLLPLLGSALARFERRGHARLVWTYLAGSAIVVVALVALAASQIRTGWLSQRYPILFGRGDPSLEAVDWSEARSALDSVASHRLVIAANWIDAAKLGAALSPRALVLCFNDDARQFRYVADQQMLIGASALVVLRRGARTDIGSDRRRIAAYFRTLDSIPARTIEVRRGGSVAIELLVFRASGLLRPYTASPALDRTAALARQVQADGPERQM